MDHVKKREKTWDGNVSEKTTQRKMMEAWIITIMRVGEPERVFKRES